MSEHRYHGNNNRIPRRGGEAPQLRCSTCGVVICRARIPVERRPGDLTEFACLLERGHDPPCENPYIPASARVYHL